MQLQINNAETGELKIIEELGTFETPQALIDYIVTKSGEDQHGYHVFAGDNLADNPTREVYHIVASQGVLICQNVLNPE